MDFAFTDEQKAFGQTAREWARREFGPIARECDDQERYPAELIPKAADMGFLGMTIPEQYGGPALGLVDIYPVIEGFMRTDPGLGTAVLTTDFGSELVKGLATDAVKDDLLPLIPRGKAVLALAITEPQAGSDVAGIQTSATREGDEWVLGGQKTFITNGTVASHAVIVARTEEHADPHRNLSTFMVPTASDGFRQAKLSGKMGQRAADTGEMFMDGVRIPDDHLIGRRGDGFRQIMQVLNQTRVLVASQATAIAQGALDRALEYATQRKAFGRPIANFQAIQFKLAEMQTRVEASRQLSLKAAWYADTDRPDPVASSMAKWFAGQTAVWCADEAVQIYGGTGYFRGADVERFYRDAKATDIYEGTKEVHKMIIARQMLGG